MPQHDQSAHERPRIERHDSETPPRFSIVVPAYNAEAYLERTLASIAAQTWRDYEVIVVDDGSTDATGRIADEHAARDGRLRVFHTPNRGIAPARNLAASEARADWLAVCDADDTWHPAKLERQAAFIDAWADARPLVALGTAGNLINARDEVVAELDFPQDPWTAYLREDAPVGQFVMINSSVVFRRADFEAVGGYRGEYSPAEDTDLWLRLAERGAFLNLPVRLTGYRTHGGNVSQTGYVTMMLCTLRLVANARRRAAGQPELTREQFDADLRADEAAHAQLMRSLRRLAHYTRAKNALSNARYLGALGHLGRAALLDPAATLRQIGTSRVVSRLLGRPPTTAPTGGLHL